LDKKTEKLLVAEQKEDQGVETLVEVLESIMMGSCNNMYLYLLYDRETMSKKAQERSLKLMLQFLVNCDYINDYQEGMAQVIK